MRIWKPAVILLLLLAACSPSVPLEISEVSERKLPAISSFTIVPGFIQQPLTLTALGDSLTYGLGDEEDIGGYVGRLAETMADWTTVSDVTVRNEAKIGRRSDETLARLEQREVAAEIREADYIVLTTGGNDIMRVIEDNLFTLTPEIFVREASQFSDRISAITGQIRQLNRDAPLILLGVYNPLSVFTGETTPFDGVIESFNEEIQNAAMQDGNSCYVPLEDIFFTNSDDVYHTDYFHPNAKGYSLMAERTIDRLEMCGLTETGGELR